jgi:DNA repair protein SbcD/Mre11
MRALHTSDWHIGVKHHGIDRTPDHNHVFAQIKAIAIEEDVDVIINTGDTFDERYPSIETLRYGWSVLEELAQIAPVIVICGNHDGAKLLELMSTILKDRLNIHFIDPSTLRRGAASVVQIPSKSSPGEIIKIAAVPFIKSANYIRDYITSDVTRSTARYADEVGSLETRVGEWLNEGYDASRDVRIFAAHLLVDGAQVSGSEYKFHVDSDFATKADRIPSADYVAFGHIHKPQAIAQIDHGRYAGSPIPVDFGELADQKSCYLVSGKPGYALTIEPRTLDVGRRMVDITGTLEEISLRRDEYKDTLARVYVDLLTPVSDLDTRVREILVNTRVCQLKARYPLTENGIVVPPPTDKEPTLTEMFGDYLAKQPDSTDPERVRRYFGELLDQVEHGDADRGTFSDVDEVLS